jgi:hypothetical protein
VADDGDFEMKKFLAAVVASVALMTSACSSVEAAKVDPATIASNGEAVAVVQCVTLGLTLIFHFVTISEASLDTVVNKMLVAEAKALGGNKVQLLAAYEMPKQGLIFRLAGGILSLPPAAATGIAVK